MPLLCTCSVRGDGLPSGQGMLRQENTWLRQPTISYSAVKAHAYLRGMFLSHASHDESIFVMRSLVCLVIEKKKKKSCIRERAEQSCLSLASQDQQSPISGGAISCFYSLSSDL